VSQSDPIKDVLTQRFAQAMTEQRRREWHESKVRREVLHRNIGKLGRGKKRASGGRYE
jgi:hypothetical protein